MSEAKPTGWTGIGYYVPGFGQYWYEESTLDVVRNTVHSIKKTAESVNEFINNPQKFTEQAVRGGINGTGFQQQAEQNEEGENQNPRIPLLSRVQHMIANGASSVSAGVLKTLLENAQIIGNKGDEKSFKEKTLQQLSHAQTQNASLYEVAQNIWSTLNSRPIVWGGMHLNPQRSSNKFLKETRGQCESESKNDGINPIESLVRCQGKYQDLRREYRLDPLHESSATHIPSYSSPPPQQPLPQTDEIERTNIIMSRFCTKTLHLSTMYAMRYLFNQSIEPTQILQAGPNFEANYLIRVGGGAIRQFFYRTIYRIIHSLISPIIEKTIHDITANLRNFFSDDMTVLRFAEEKINEFGRYYGQIERGRQAFLAPPNPQNAGYAAGNFSEFLEMTMRTYGTEQLSEEALLKSFQEYIATHYTPSPKLEIRGHRIPLISTLIEKVIHSIRKALVRLFLRRTEILHTILTQGTGSAHQAQLGLKKILLEKLSSTLENMQRPREGGMRQALITRELHGAIQQHTRTLHRFIAIQSCQNDEQTLRNLDNRVNALTSEIFESIRSFFQWEPLSLQAVLENATTNLIETSLLSIFDDKERQIELQMQGLLSVLEKSYEYVPPEDRFNLELRFREESRNLDATLNGLLEKLTRISIEASIDDYFKNASIEKHQQTVEFIEKEKKEQQQFDHFLSNFIEQLGNAVADVDDRDAIREVRQVLNNGIGQIECYMRKIATTLRSTELSECYADTKGDLYNCYAIQIHWLDYLARETLSPLLLELDKMEKMAAQLKKCNKSLELVNTISSDSPLKEIHSLLEKIRTTLPEEMQNATQESLNAIQENFGRLKVINEQLQIFAQVEEFNQELVQIREVRTKLSDLSSLIQRFHQGEPLSHEIETRYSQLMENRAGQLFTEVLRLIEVQRIDDLHAVFYPRWMRSRNPSIFSLLERYEQTVQRKISSLELGIQALNKDSLQQEKIQLGLQIKHDRDLVKTTIEELGDPIEDEFNNMGEGISAFLVGFQHCRKRLWQVTNALSVEGCIAVGEMHFMQHKGLIISTITEKITKAMTHLLDALGEPFHYKQLILKTIVLDIVNREGAR